MKNSRQDRAVVLQDRFARKTVSYLSAVTADMPHDISERLRSARVQAVSQRKIVKLRTAENINVSGNSAALTWRSGDGWNWWGRVGSVLPLIALVVGLLACRLVFNLQRRGFQLLYLRRSNILFTKYVVSTSVWRVGVLLIHLGSHWIKCNCPLLKNCW